MLLKVQILFAEIFSTSYAVASASASEINARSLWIITFMTVETRFFLVSYPNADWLWRKILRESNSRFKERTSLQSTACFFLQPMVTLFHLTVRRWHRLRSWIESTWTNQRSSCVTLMPWFTNGWWPVLTLTGLIFSWGETVMSLYGIIEDMESQSKACSHQTLRQRNKW